MLLILPEPFCDVQLIAGATVANAAAAEAAQAPHLNSPDIMLQREYYQSAVKHLYQALGKR